LPYQSDYVLRLIEQITGLIRRAMEKMGLGDAEEPCELAGQAIGLALGLDPALASRGGTLPGVWRGNQSSEFATALQVTGRQAQELPAWR